eukprot:TRINITY_DN1302_c0_g1_i4.p1 TRINITY_DN1302_c0_g1~~TRINITY_DN1302_c0_g1_i4.p1  ORF type:complete len:627 (+),score=107.87 TRINITY_DN1302_c0_g1_i4:420-2300(+)
MEDLQRAMDGRLCTEQVYDLPDRSHAYHCLTPSEAAAQLRVARQVTAEEALRHRAESDPPTAASAAASATSPPPPRAHSPTHPTGAGWSGPRGAGERASERGGGESSFALFPVELLDVQVLHASHPTTFLIPSAVERASLEAGDVCYVIAKIPRVDNNAHEEEDDCGWRTERLQVCIVDRRRQASSDSIHYVGCVLRGAQLAGGPPERALVAVRPCHVARLEVTEQHGAFYPRKHLAMATHRVLREGRPVLCIRTTPLSAPLDAGLGLFSEVDEDEAYINDESNVSLITLEEGVNLCPALEIFLRRTPTHFGVHCCKCSGKGQSAGITGVRYRCVKCHLSYCSGCMARTQGSADEPAAKRRRTGGSSAASDDGHDGPARDRAASTQPKNEAQAEALLGGASGHRSRDAFRARGGKKSGEDEAAHVCEFTAIRKEPPGAIYTRASENELFCFTELEEWYQRDEGENNSSETSSTAVIVQHLRRRDLSPYMYRLRSLASEGSALAGIVEDVISAKGFSVCPIVTDGKISHLFTVGLYFSYDIPELVVFGDLHPPLFTVLAADWLSMNDAACGDGLREPYFASFPSTLSTSLLEVISELSGVPVPTDDAAFSAVAYSAVDARESIAAGY